MNGFRNFDLTGRTALVTGGGTGLGYAMAQGLAAAGARVLITGRRHDLLDEAMRTLRRDVPGAAVVTGTVDLYDRDSIDALVDRTLATVGGIDILVGNAGAVHAEQLEDMTLPEIDRVLQLNLTANISLTQAFVPHMKAQGWGRIIFSSSTSSAMAAPFQGNLAYAASKSGLNGFARVIAGDLGHFGITVNCLILGLFWTSIVRNAEQQLRDTVSAEAADDLIAGFTEMTALGRLGDPDDLHGIVQLLGSDAGRYITGASIPLDGGTSIMMRPLRKGP